MILLALYGVLILVYFACPLVIQLIILAINSLSVDPIPVIDEVLMIAGIISKLNALENALEFIHNHPLIIWFAFLIIAILVLVLIF